MSLGSSIDRQIARVSLVPGDVPFHSEPVRQRKHEDHKLQESSEFQGVQTQFRRPGIFEVMSAESQPRRQKRKR
jgi:hypothetical protein